MISWSASELRWLRSLTREDIERGMHNLGYAKGELRWYRCSSMGDEVEDSSITDVMVPERFPEFVAEIATKLNRPAFVVLYMFADAKMRDQMEVFLWENE